MLRLTRHRLWLIYSLVFLSGLAFRLFIALRLPNDEPDDGRVYAQIARNVLEQHVYSHESEPPYPPSLIRLPGYPFLLAAIYSIAGHGNNTAVRVAQALIDSATCVLIALLAFQWMTREKWKHRAAIAALALAAACPFTAIYVSTILTEVPTNFLAVTMMFLATLAFKSTQRNKSMLLWGAAGFIAGLAVFFRPDSGLFAAAIGFTILVSAVFGQGKIDLHSLSKRFFGAVPRAAIFSVMFCLVLVPWTVRNYRVFHLFQPLSPTHGEMPGEFVPRGYLMWLRTWLDDGRYVGPVLWSLDTSRIPIGRFPASAFDSSAEKDRVAALLEKYNHPVDNEPEPPATAQPSPAVGGQESPATSEKPAESPAEPDENDEESDEESDEEPTAEELQDVEMTPEIDAGFAQIARERIARAPLRYYLILPVKRTESLWIDTHSQYYPFEGELLPLSDLDHSIHQHIWLPLFALLTALYSVLGVAGAWQLWRSRDLHSYRWMLLTVLIIVFRLGFFGTLENPEPRYAVEIFPFLSVLGGLAVAAIRGQAANTVEG